VQKSLAFVALAAAVSVTSAAAAPVAPAPISALAASNGSIAYASMWTPRVCEHAYLLRPPRVFPAGQCPQVSTGRGIASVSVAGTRVVWLAFAGGNIREWSLLTATATRPKPRLLRFSARDVDLPSPIVLGSGGSVIPYVLGRSVVALRTDGSRAFAWTAPVTVRALAASGSSVAAVLQGGRAVVLSAGRVVRTAQFDGEADAVALAGSTLVLQRGRVLDLRVGNTSRTWTLPSHALLQDASPAAAIYAATGRIHRVTFSSGADTVVARGSLAQLDGGRLVVASGNRLLI
jgi:hypothetical protein